MTVVSSLPVVKLTKLVGARNELNVIIVAEPFHNIAAEQEPGASR